MSVSLSYTSVGKLSPAIKEQILTDVNSIERDWIVESIVFFDDSSQTTPMTGDTKLFTPDPADCAAAGADAQFIIEKLSEWSRRHQISWSLNIAGADLGLVDGEEVDPKILATVQGLLSMGAMDFDDPDSFL